ncbi:hypothetical protein [Paenibacillus oryzisoli]|uniref:ABM domain-containing protein n=1 Tax=Paenibacillus oryzisoli TaxID=1850517 RepID=A0A198AKU5_9BACL|nr:hypothetical protein [Paenibacillus oryzisoli]OAS21548.1 hypothetical protein A8708_16575 [Paenibacillus oryzisoli]
MYARLSMFRLRPHAPLSFAEQWAEKTNLVHQSLKGFKGITFLGENITNEFGYISYWETKEDALAAGDIIEVKVYSTLSRTYIESPPIIAIYGVYNLPAGNGELIFTGKFNWSELSGKNSSHQVCFFRAVTGGTPRIHGKFACLVVCCMQKISRLELLI